MARTAALLLWAQALGLAGAQPSQLTLDPPWTPAFVGEKVTLTCGGSGAAGPTDWYVNQQLQWRAQPGRVPLSSNRRGSHSYQCRSAGVGLSPPVTLSFSDAAAQRALPLPGHRGPLAGGVAGIGAGGGGGARALLGAGAAPGGPGRAPRGSPPGTGLPEPPQPPAAPRPPPAPLLPGRGGGGGAAGLPPAPAAGRGAAPLGELLLRGADGDGERAETQRRGRRHGAQGPGLGGVPGGAAPRGEAGGGRPPGAGLLGGRGDGAPLLLLAPAGLCHAAGHGPPLRARRRAAPGRRLLPLHGHQRRHRGRQPAAARHRPGAGGRCRHRDDADGAVGASGREPQPELLGAGGHRAGDLHLAAGRPGAGLGARPVPGGRGAGARRDLPVPGHQPPRCPPRLPGAQPRAGPLGDGAGVAAAGHSRGRGAQRVPPAPARCCPGLAPPAPAPRRDPTAPPEPEGRPPEPTPRPGAPGDEEVLYAEVVIAERGGGASPPRSPRGSPRAGPPPVTYAVLPGPHARLRLPSDAYENVP
ncbi:low affinity immunoglobulin gamma Fc region receptor II-a isoform X10 [Opisthocomus hoazin]|uniref:low affinity immunoglobulin gamma Fc region receptor II-a isoform X10 n=1 Tax=Opisthocomus hoazin TaxID=30419 RepID=UPI003F52D3D5